MERRFLLIGCLDQTAWPQLFARALAPLGELVVVTEQAVRQNQARLDYDIIFLDATVIDHIPALLDFLQARKPRIPLVVFSALPQWEAVRAALRAGAIDYIHKSFDAAALQDRVRRIIDLDLAAHTCNGSSKE